MDTQSAIHRLDPRAKGIVMLLLLLPILCTQSLIFMFIVTAWCLTVIVFAKFPLTIVLKNLRPFLWLFGITFCIHLFWTQGSSIPPFPVKGVNMTYKGLEQGFFFSYRLVIFIVVAALFTLTTSPTDLTDSLERMLKPFKRFGLPAHELAMIMTIALRFIPTLIEEADRLRKAQLARGAHFYGGPIRRAKALIPLTVPLFLSAYRRADELAMAMDARCYRGGLGRTNFHQLKCGGRDYMAIAFAGITCGSVFFIV